jgi:hypothetical protein
MFMVGKLPTDVHEVTGATHSPAMASKKAAVSSASAPVLVPGPPVLSEPVSASELEPPSEEDEDGRSAPEDPAGSSEAGSEEHAARSRLAPMVRAVLFNPSMPVTVAVGSATDASCTRGCDVGYGFASSTMRSIMRWTSASVL